MKRLFNGVHMRLMTAVAAGSLVLVACGVPEDQADSADDGQDAAAEGDFGPCGPDWDAVLAAAADEGEVVMYSTRSEDDNAAVMSAFMEAYPEIAASSVRLVGGDMISRVDQELAANSLSGDVLVHAERQWSAERVSEGALVTPAGPSTELWAGAEEFWETGVVQIAAEPWVIGYNTELVADAPTDWDSLLDNTEFAGRIGLNEVTGLTVAIWFDFVIQTMGDDYMERLAELNPTIYPNSAPLTQGLGSGELAWAPYSLVSSLKPLMEAGAPVDWVVPESGTWALVRDAMVLDDAPHPCAARVLLDFMMSEEGQQLWNGNQSGFSVAPGVEVDGEIEFDQSLVTYVDYLEYTEEDLAEMQALVDQLFR